MLSYLAAITSRVLLGTSVLVLPMRSPFVVAKQAATLDSLSGGRLVLGIGVGSFAEEYTNVHADFRTRGLRMDEMIALFHHLGSVTGARSRATTMDSAMVCSSRCRLAARSCHC